MARSKQVFSVVTVSSDGVVAVMEMGREELSAWLANHGADANVQTLVFSGEQVEFTVRTETVVDIGTKPRKRQKPIDEAAEKPKRKYTRKANGVGAEKVEAVTE